jgi:hypothetical protein
MRWHGEATMQPSIGRNERLAAAAIALLATAALVLQYVLLLEANRGTLSPAVSTLRFFSYFTVLSNGLVALATATAAFGRRGFFSRPGVRAGIALCIAVTGLVYLLVLRQLWQPQGAQWWADIGLHYLTPMLYLGWWATATPHGVLSWRQLPRWLLFPLAYLAWTLFRQRAIEPWSPYPFLDLREHGQTALLANIASVLLLFVALGGVLLAVDRLLGRRSRPEERVDPK